jgi:hypothetical protein
MIACRSEPVPASAVVFTTKVASNWRASIASTDGRREVGRDRVSARRGRFRKALISVNSGWRGTGRQLASHIARRSRSGHPPAERSDSRHPRIQRGRPGLAKSGPLPRDHPPASPWGTGLW